MYRYRRFAFVCAVALCPGVLVLAGCGNPDGTLTAAPPPGPNAVPAASAPQNKIPPEKGASGGTLSRGGGSGMNARDAQ